MVGNREGRYGQLGKGVGRDRKGKGERGMQWA